MFEQAIWVFALHTRLFPESANAWDSLAEAHWKAGKIREARGSCQRAIQLDPDGAIGKNARDMLQKIQAEQK